jgi:hypothetical protein
MSKRPKRVTFIKHLFSTIGCACPWLAFQQNTIKAVDYDHASEVVIGLQPPQLRFWFTKGLPWKSLLTGLTNYQIKAMKKPYNLYDYQSMDQRLKAVPVNRNCMNELKQVI